MAEITVFEETAQSARVLTENQAKNQAANQANNCPVVAAAQATEPFESKRIAPANLYVVIPMFNEAARLQATLNTLAASSINRADVQILFSDDGSTDRSSETVLSLSQPLKFARPIEVSMDAVNRGKGAAVRRGVLTAAFADAELIAFLDADLSLDPGVLDDAIAVLRQNHCEVVVGERIVDFARQPKLRRLVSLMFKHLTALVAPTGVADTQCACKVFTRRAALEVFEPLQTNGFAFDVEVLLRAKQLGLKTAEFPVNWQHTDGSRVNPITDAVRMARDVVRVRRLL
jgi:dolichyl-phosphate beta-glucosyltransferase